jgi:hypothetical protein
MTTFFPIEEGLQQEQQELSDMAKVGIGWDAKAIK